MLCWCKLIFLCREKIVEKHIGPIYTYIGNLSKVDIIEQKVTVTIDGDIWNWTFIKVLIFSSVEVGNMVII